MASLPTLDYFPNVPEVRPLSSTGITRLHRYYGPIRHPPRPGLSLAGVRLASKPPLGFPVLRRSPYTDMPSPLPRWDRRRDRFAPLKPTATAFPESLAGRLPHWSFRGLLSVHVSYGLPACGTASRHFPSKASTMSLPPSSLRLLPAGAKVAGWELHPLKIDTLARRTKTPDPWYVGFLKN